MTEAGLITGILNREGGYLEDPKAGPTNFGITARTWGLYRGWGRPATREEVKRIAREQAVDFYQRQYFDQSPFKAVAYEPLRAQLIDFGINSGNARAIRWLQRVLNIPVTGVMDERTIMALQRENGRLVNAALVAARCYMLDQAIDHGDIEKQFEEGLESRALSFVEFTV